MSDTTTDSTRKAKNEQESPRQRLRTWQPMGAPISENEAEAFSPFSRHTHSTSFTGGALGGGNPSIWQRAAVVQTELTVNEPSYQYEQEAERVADTVMRVPLPMVAPPAIGPPPLANPLYTLRGRASEGNNSSVDERRMPPGSGPSLMRVPTYPSMDISSITHISPVQALLIARAQAERAEALQSPPPVSPAIQSRIQAMNGSGTLLPDRERTFFESRMGADFSGVRIHTNHNAVQTSRDINARAFTTGNNIAFNEGEYQPGTTAGRHLLAHELTHTVQQGAAGELKRKPAADEGVCPVCGKKGKGTCGGCREAFVPPAQKLAITESDGAVQRFEVDEEEKTPTTELASESATPELPNAEPVAEAVTEEASAAAEAKASDMPEAKEATAVESLDASKEGNAEGVDQALPEESKAEGESPLTTTEGQPEAKGEGATGEGLKAEGAISAQEATSPPQAASEAAAPAAAEAMPERPEATDAPTIEAMPAMAVEDSGEVAVDEAEFEGGEQAVAEAGVKIDPADEAALGEPIGGGQMPSGGGGGGAVEDLPPPPPVPDVSQSEPAQAMAAVSNLPPVELQNALGSVSGAVGNFGGKQREELQANPPELERPSGAEAKREAETPPPELPPAKELGDVERKPEGPEIPVPEAKPTAESAPPPAAQAAPPSSADDVSGAVARISASDPNAKIEGGAPPKIELKGNADPQNIPEQEGKLDKSVDEAYREGQQEAAIPMGEKEVYPVVPSEMLTAQVPAGDAASVVAGAEAALAEAGGAAGGADAISLIAQEERGDEIQAAVAEAQAEMSAQQQDYEAQMLQEREKSSQEMDQIIAQNSALQEEERAAALGEVEQMRSEWSEEQASLVQETEAEASQVREEGLQEVTQQQVAADQQAAEHIQQGEQEAKQAKLAGEQEAKAEKRKGEQESGGFFGGLFSDVENFFNDVKNAVKSALEIAQKAIKSAIDSAKKLATSIIEKARQAVVGIIKRVGDALIAIGDRLLANFPELRDRFRNIIEQRVNQAVEAVNKLAEDLKENVQKALDMLGEMLNQALGLLEQGLMAVINKAQSEVQGAIEFAKNAVETLGTFAVLIEDIAANPGQWLSNLAAGVMDGITNHLWSAFQAQIQEWFTGKLEEVLGVGMEVFNILRQGGMDLAKIGQMAWEALVDAIPSALIEILIEKVVSMIIPAAGAILIIIEGLQAAWGTVSRIIQAIEQFVNFLKAVKSGNSGPMFANALASAAIVVVDFVSNWLIAKLKKAGKALANKLKGIAKKLMGGKKGKNKNKNKDKDKDTKFTAKERQAGVAAFEREEQKYAENGAIGKADAKKTAKNVKGKHPVFKSIKVVDGGDSWDYKYILRIPGKKVTGTNKYEGEGNKEEDIINKAKSNLKSWFSKRKFLGLFEKNEKSLAKKVLNSDTIKVFRHGSTSDTEYTFNKEEFDNRSQEKMIKSVFKANSEKTYKIDITPKIQTLLNEYNKHLSSMRNINKKNIDKEDKDKVKELRVKVNKASEEIGQLARVQAMKEYDKDMKLGLVKNKHGDLFDEGQHKSNTDATSQTSSGNPIMIEDKGRIRHGKGDGYTQKQLGKRKISPGVEAQQGTYEYTKKLAEEMKNNKEKKQKGELIDQGLEDKNLRSFISTASIPDQDIKEQNQKIIIVTIKEFDLRFDKVI